MTLQEIKAAVAQWEGIRKTDTAITYLKSKFSLGFTKAQYEQWIGVTASAEEACVSLGVNASGELMCFISINEIGPKTTSKDQVLIATTTTELGHSRSSSDLSPSEAQKRIQDWNDNYMEWFNENKPDDIVALFYMPLNDFKDIFSVHNAATVSGYLGLNRQGVPKGRNSYVELIYEAVVPSSEKEATTMYKDLTKPKPPFSK